MSIDIDSPPEASNSAIKLRSDTKIKLTATISDAASAWNKINAARHRDAMACIDKETPKGMREEKRVPWLMLDGRYEKWSKVRFADGVYESADDNRKVVTRGFISSRAI